MSARQTPAKSRPLGTTAAEQSTLSSIDHSINTQACICGKDCDLLPSHTWGKQLGEHQRERATPKGLAFGLCNREGAGKAGCSLHQRFNLMGAASRGAVAVPALCPLASWPSRVFILIKSQASRPWFGVQTRCKLGRGGGHRVAASPALPRIPCVILGEPFPALGLRSPLLA